MFQQFTPFEYLLIEAANNKGMDKVTYTQRIDWVRSNLDNLEDFYDVAKEPFLYKKAVKNIRDVQAGKPTGALVRFDSVCSGMQLLSVLTRCRKGCEATGAINKPVDERPNAYQEVANVMQGMLGESIEVDPADIKLAVMTALYGSKAEPKKLFTGHQLDAFYAACSTVAPGAFKMLPIMVDAWNPNTDSHSWVMPDGHQVYVPVMISGTLELPIEELDGAVMNTFVTQQAPKDFSVSLAAHITHSVDSYVLRSLVRYCNYDKPKMIKLAKLIQVTLMERNLNMHQVTNCVAKQNLERVNLFDISIVNDINEDNINVYSSEVLRLVAVDINQMLMNDPFDVIVVHDSFISSPLYMNILRGWYNEILARMSNSNLLEFIIEQLLNEPTKIGVFQEDLSEEIRNNSYAIN